MLPGAASPGRLWPLLCCLLFVIRPGLAQNSAANRARLQTELTARQAAFQRQNAELFVTYMLPAAVQEMGGAAKAQQLLLKGFQDMKAEGYHLQGLSYGVPGPIVQAGQELQCAVPQTITWRDGGNTLPMPTTLVAVSSDGGQHWRFVDVAGRDREAVRKIIPNLHEALLMPKKR